MLGGKGFYRGSTVLISGTAGTGKTSLAGHFAQAACDRGERCLYFAFEESPGQLIRNMNSIGLNLGKYVEKNLLQIHSTRATFYGLELHLATIHRMVQRVQPEVVVFDPVGALLQAGNRRDAHSMVVRLIDFLKLRRITVMLTNLTAGGEALERTEVDVSSIVDTWLLVRHIEIGGERSRALNVLKSRGMGHSNQLRKFLLTDHGVDLLEPSGRSNGSSRVSGEARGRAPAHVDRDQSDRKRRDHPRKRADETSPVGGPRKRDR
jgi:circadian clock protein KaiC